MARTETRNDGGIPEHSPILSPEEVAAYGEAGYIVVNEALDVAFVRAMAEATDRLVDGARGLEASDSHFDLAPDHSAEAPRLRRISSPTELDEIFVEAAFSSALGDIAADLAGGAVKFYHAKINFKLPRSEATNIQWHQDWPHFPHTNTNLVALSVPFHARTRENGAVQIVPGSHRLGPLSVWKDGQYVFTCEDDMDPGSLGQAVYVECVPGDVQCHHGLAVHASAPNPTDEVCITLTVQYAAADAFAYTAPVIDFPPSRADGARRDAPFRAARGRSRRTAARFQRRLQVSLRLPGRGRRRDVTSAGPAPGAGLPSLCPICYDITYRDHFDRKRTSMDQPVSHPSDRDAVLAEARHIGVHRGGRWLVRHVDIAVRKGEIVTLIGPNGSGKSTCAKALLGLMSVDEGHIVVPREVRIGYVPQSLVIDWTLPLTAGRLLTLTARHGAGDIEAALDRVGLAGMSGAPVQALSGGEFQRALLARAIIRRPDLLVLDEPVQGVDFTGQIALYELIRDIRDELGCGVLLISHDLHIVMAETDTVVCLNGHVCCSGTPKLVAEDPEYRRLFGPKAAEALAVYRHDHDHTHADDGSIVEVRHDH